MTQNITVLVDKLEADLPHSTEINADDHEALKDWFEQCEDALLPYFEATEDYRGWETDADLKLMTTAETREWYEPVTEERQRMDSRVTLNADGTGETLETTEKTEEVVVDRALNSEVVGHYLDVQADTERERRATAALADALGLTVTEYGGTHTRFTHRLEHPNT